MATRNGIKRGGGMAMRPSVYTQIESKIYLGKFQVTLAS
jgi:hypothetical protein